MKSLVFGLILLTCTAPASAGELQLSIRDGRVTMDAQDVTLRQILMEWARIGKTRLVNADRITGGPVTMKLENVPEKQALETILRTIPGYMAVPRQSMVADASIYDSILLMPTTTAVAAARPPSAGFRGQPGGANLTQLRPAPPAFSPGMLPEQTEPPADQADDPAIAAAAAAGLVPVNAPMPGPGPISAPLMAPGGSQPASTQNPPPGAVAPNPWNAPPGATSAPTFTPPPPPPTSNAPITRPRPPVPDR
jgi:hypothetical protein